MLCDVTTEVAQRPILVFDVREIRLLHPAEIDFRVKKGILEACEDI
jgi:hypothetical protein